MRAAQEAAKGLDMQRTDSTVAQWLDTWVATYPQPNIRPSTAEYYANHIKYNVKSYIGCIKLSKLTARDMQQLYNDLKDHGSVKEKDGSLSSAHGAGHTHDAPQLP